MWFSKSKSLQQVIFLISFIVSGFTIINLQNNRYQQLKKEINNPNYVKEEAKSLATLNLRKLMPTFGFDNLVADSIYLDFVQYFGDKTAREATGYSLVPKYFGAIANHDPQFTEAYLILSTANSMYAGKADETVALMNQVLQETSFDNQNTHLIWTLKAMDESLFLGDINAARYSYEQAAKIVLNTNINNREAIASFNQKKAQFLATNPDPTEAQIKAWQSVLPNVVKEEERKVIRDRIKELKAKNSN